MDWPYRFYGAFTLESILAAAFGRVINLQRGEADEVTEAAKGVFDGGKDKVVRFCLFILCKFLLSLCVYTFASLAIYMCACLFPMAIVNFPFLERAMHFFLNNFTKAVEPWKVLHHTALKQIEACRSGTAKQARVSCMVTR